MWGVGYIDWEKRSRVRKAIDAASIVSGGVLMAILAVLVLVTSVNFFSVLLEQPKCDAGDIRCLQGVLAYGVRVLYTGVLFLITFVSMGLLLVFMIIWAKEV